MPSFETKNFGRISCDAGAAIEFPCGLPGFEERRRFLIVQMEHTNPLVFLQSLEDPDLCFTTAPVLSVDPQYRLSMSDDDMERIGLVPGRRPRLGEDVLCLAVMSLYETGPTANLMAPLVVNVHTLRAVQAVSQEQCYSHQHAMGEPQEAALCS